MVDKDYLDSLSGEEKIEEVKKNLDNSLNEKDSQATFENLIFLLTLFQNKYDYLSVLDFIEEYGKKIELSNEEKNKILDYKIQAQLKNEQYNELIKSLDEKELIKNDDDNDNPNIYFYRAIAFEALDETALSIESLEKIEDSIPRSALINKYLKLSMLYLKNGNFEKAEEAYKYASMVDYRKRNDMFSLVESDLLMASEKYEEALDSFQSFFLKSANKYKYLDRYILINIKLNRLDEAYAFFKEYEEKPSIKLSSQNRYSFYKASYTLLNLMGRSSEAEKVKSLMEEAKPVYFKEETEDNSVILSLSKALKWPISYNDKPKNVVRKYAQLVLKENQSFAYIYKNEDGYYYTYLGSKQMMEKKLDMVELANKELKNSLIVESDEERPYFITEKLEKEEKKSLYLPLKDEYSDFGFIIIELIKNKDNLIVLRDIIFEKLKELSIIKGSAKFEKSINNALENAQVGFIKISGKYVEFYNKYSMNIFSSNRKIITFEEFYSLEANKDKYVDSFEKSSKQIVPFIIESKRKEIEFISSVFEGEVYSFVRNVTKEKEEKDSKDKYFYHSGLRFFNRNYLEKRITSIESSYAILGLYINGIDDEDAILSRDDKLDTLYTFLSQISPISELYYLGENHFLLRLISTDKRVLSGIFEKVTSGISRFYKKMPSLRDADIFGFASKSLKNKTTEEVFKMIEYGFKTAKEKGSFVILDNDEKRDYAIYKTYEGEVIKLLKNDNIDLIYKPIINEKDNTIHYFSPKLIPPFEMPTDVFERIIKSNLLTVKADSILTEKAFKDLSMINKNIRAVIKINKESLLNSNFIKKISLLFKQLSLSGRVIFAVESYDREEYAKSEDSILNAGIKLSKIIYSLDDLKISDKYQQVYIDIDEMDSNALGIIKSFVSSSKVEAILSNLPHLDGTLSYRDGYRNYSEDEMNKF